MKSAILTVLACTAATTISACGDSGKCAGDHVGKWDGTTIADAIDFGGDCSFAYTGVGCTSSGTYDAAIEDSGTVAVQITASTGGACLPTGSYSCVYGVNSSLLSFNCGAGMFTYSRD